MSFDIFLQAFRSGDPIDADGDAAVAVLQPLIGSRGEGWCRIALTDGEADVFGVEEPAEGLMFNHVSGLLAWDVIVDVARAGGFTIMPTGCPACVLSEEAVTQLPPGLDDDAVVIGSGTDLRRVVESNGTNT